MKVQKSGLMLAGAAAALLAAGYVNANAEQGKANHKNGMVKCEGTNACKGKSECKTKGNGCKGQNACKGKGYTSMKSADECTKAGGTVVEKS